MDDGSPAASALEAQARGGAGNVVGQAAGPGRDEIPPDVGRLPPHLRKPRLRRSEAVEYLAIVHGVEIRPGTLAKWAALGAGPAFDRLNRTPLYRRGEIDRWVAANLKPAIVHR